MNHSLHVALDGLREGRTDALSGYCAAQSAQYWTDDAHVTDALARAVRTRWPNPDLATIAEFAKQVNDNGDLRVTMSPLFVEAVIRGALGETHLTDGVPVEYRFPWTIALLAQLGKE